jgi:hypothetical protein
MLNANSIWYIYPVVVIASPSDAIGQLAQDNSVNFANIISAFDEGVRENQLV